VPFGVGDPGARVLIGSARVRAENFPHFPKDGDLLELFLGFWVGGGCKLGGGGRPVGEEVEETGDVDVDRTGKGTLGIAQQAGGFKRRGCQQALAMVLGDAQDGDVLGQTGGWQYRPPDGREPSAEGDGIMEWKGLLVSAGVSSRMSLHSRRLSRRPGHHATTFSIRRRAPGRSCLLAP